MKLNTKFVLTTFLIVLLISISSILTFFNLASKVIRQQQEKTILNATTNFAFQIQYELQNIDEEFKSFLSKKNNLKESLDNNSKIDFIFTLKNDSTINEKEFVVKSNSYLNVRNKSFNKFFSNNPQMLLRYQNLPNGKTYYYGKIIDANFLNSISQKINSEIALLVNDSPVEVSNPSANQKKLLTIVEAAKDLKFKNNFDLFSQETSDADFISSIYSSKHLIFPFANVNFLIFQSFKESAEFRYTLQIIMLIIIIAGSGITFIIVILSTGKLRRQINLLNEVVNETGKGNLNSRVSIITNDEIGKFGESFNRMLDEIVEKNKKEKDYSEFIAIINQKQTLKDLCDAALKKIINSTRMSFGAIHLVENKNVKLISSFGFALEKKLSISNEYYLLTIDKGDFTELFYNQNFPEVDVGLAKVKIKYIIFYPIFYNKEVTAIIELASENIPENDIKEYLRTIHDQLAIGIINSSSFEKLEKLVDELKKLNEDYQNQNEQIIKQNEQLKLLHKELENKAEELEKQRLHAIKLTKVKSDFLASMSHELKTPLISINGLSEILLKNLTLDLNTKEKIKIIYRNGKKLLTLINNILEFSKLETGKIEIKNETFLLADLIEELYLTVEQFSKEKNLKLIFDLPKKKNVLLNADKSKLEQVISNLLVNAIKFTENGFVKLSVQIIDDDNLLILVEDTGIGISESDKEKIFQEFKQVDSSLSRKFSGAGLGLAICKKYLELMNSKLELESELGKGSKFYFQLNDVVLEIIDSEEEKFLSINNNPKKLLIISNIESAKELFAGYLKNYLVDFEFVDDYKSAEEKINNTKYDGIILNSLNDNWKFIYDIKKSKINNEATIIFSIILENEKIGWEPNVFDYLTKVDFHNQLQKAVSKIENIENNRIKNIALISDSELITQEEFSAEYKIELIKIPDKLNKYDLIIIDLSYFKENSLELIYNLSINKKIKGSQILFLLPENYIEEIFSKFNKKIFEIIKKIKLHPMDILKVLRDKLNLQKSIDENIIEIFDEDVNRNKIENNDKNKIKILVVDDDNDALFTIGEFLREIDCDVINAHNGMECLMMLNHINPDVVLLDIMMPHMDGFETIKRIRNDKRFTDLPIIALTAFAMLENKDVIEKNSFNDIITKPINSQTLITTVNKFIKK